MAITTKQSLNDKKYKQDSGDTLNLKGTTIIGDGGKLKLDTNNTNKYQATIVTPSNEINSITTSLKVIVGSVSEFVNALNVILNGISGEVVLSNDITLSSDITNLNLENITINGKGKKIIFSGKKIISSSNNVVFKDVNFVGTKHSANGSDLILELNGGNVFFEYCIFSDLCYNQASPTSNIKIATTSNIVIDSCKYINSNNRNLNKLVFETSNVASSVFLSIFNFMERHGCDICVKGTLPTNNMLFIDNSTNILEGGNFVSWTNKKMLGGTQLSRMGYWKGTQAQYNAISSKDDNTLYFVEEVV